MPAERKRRSKYMPAATRPPPEWLPPSEPRATFLCVALHCTLSADSCCRRQRAMILGTPEPKFALCHPDCVQGRAVRGAMPEGYEPAREWFKPGIHAKRRSPGQPAPQIDQTKLLTELREVVAYTVTPKGDN